MNANGRRVRQANNGYRHLARINGKSVAGGRPNYRATSNLSVAQAIARERAKALAEAKRKVKKK